MATVNTDLFKIKSHIKLSTRQDGDGNEVQVEVREDEEQSVKLQEIIDLLVAAGYFRARIKGLSPFDKVIGGMTWCIELCSVDVNVDLLFRENLTIGQKIALTEKIVAVLPKMKCPHSIEPHQIQGLDFIHIFPVVQWLVKRSLEYRGEMAEFTRLYTYNQYRKDFGIVSDTADIKNRLYGNVKNVQEAYRPHRYYRRKNAPPEDLQTRVQVTLLEYNHLGETAASSVANTPEELLEERKTEELNVERLMKNMATAGEDESISYETLSKEEKAELEKHYAALQDEIEDGGTKSRELKTILLLEQQKQALSDRCSKLEGDKESLQKSIEETSSYLKELRFKQQEADKSLQELNVTKAKDPEVLKRIEELVVLHDSLKEQEKQFREQCKLELARLQALIADAQKSQSPESPSKPNVEVGKELDSESEKLKSLRLQLAKRNRAIAALQRQLDEVPSRAELAQYQRRFLELYNQVAAKHRETKQYYTLYNTLDDTRIYIQKELRLLNSILDSYPEAMLSTAGKEEFIKQFESIVENIKQTKRKVEDRCSQERMQRDRLNATLLGLVEQQRRYVAAVRQLSIECRKNEALLAQRSS